MILGHFCFFTPRQITAVETGLGPTAEAVHVCGRPEESHRGPAAVEVKRCHILPRLQWGVAGLGGALEAWEGDVLTGLSQLCFPN